MTIFTAAIGFLVAILGGTAAILGLSVIAAERLATGSGEDIAAWVQAVGAIVAIIAGFATLAIQTMLQGKAENKERKAIVEAACLLAFDALETVNERLENALAKKPKRLSLQGDRTTEMVLAMREFDTSRLPAALLSNFIRVRSHIYAINEKITEVYEIEDAAADKDSEKLKRRERFVSTARVRIDAVKLFDQLQGTAKSFGVQNRNLSTGYSLREYLEELKAQQKL